MAEAHTRQKSDNDDYICRKHILNGMSDALFDTYWNVTIVKELWEKLEERYISKDANYKKFLVSIFNNYKIVDDRSVIEQLHEIEHVVNSYKFMHMDENKIVSSIIDKLPLSWRQ